jgi:hypothetical protein
MDVRSHSKVGFLIALPQARHLGNHARLIRQAMFEPPCRLELRKTDKGSRPGQHIKRQPSRCTPTMNTIAHASMTGSKPLTGIGFTVCGCSRATSSDLCSHRVYPMARMRRGRTSILEGVVISKQVTSTSDTAKRD